MDDSDIKCDIPKLGDLKRGKHCTKGNHESHVTKGGN